MLRTKIELVPFGVEAYTKNLSVMYLANIGESVIGSRNGVCDYLIGYYETASPVAGTDSFSKFKLIKNYDRNNTCFAMMEAIYDKKLPWMTFDELMSRITWSDKDNAEFISCINADYIRSIVDRFDYRAMADLGVCFKSEDE
jgi:hypothetical protein